MPSKSRICDPYLCKDAVHHHESKKGQHSMDQVQLYRLIPITANGDLQLKVQLPRMPAQQDGRYTQFCRAPGAGSTKVLLHGMGGSAGKLLRQAVRPTPWAAPYSFIICSAY